MVTNVTWLTTAQGQVRSVAGYMVKQYSLQVAEKFIEEIENRLQKMLRYPESGRPSPIPNIRYFIIKKRYNFYYKCQGTRLYVIYVWDTKRDPKKNPYGL
jgi:plasmid stabilization system protein ParE